MSTYQRDLRSFGDHVGDEGAFHELWHGFDALRCDHAEGRVDAVGVGLGLRAGDCGARRPTIVIQVARAGEIQPPSSLAGLPVHVEEVGDIVAPQVAVAGLNAPWLQKYDRPPCGVSIAPLGAYYAGTLGFYASSQGATYLVSCRHVLDPTLNGTVGGPGVRQPSAHDGGASQAQIGVTKYLGALQGSVGIPPADVAAALVTGPYDPRILIGDNQFAPIAAPNASVVPGQTVRKSGRTTGATTGRVELVTAQMTVRYANRTAQVFQDCIAVNNTARDFFEIGDDGALLTNDSFQPVGMMLAISVGPTGIAYAQRIETVLASLNAAAGPGANFQIVTGTGA